MKSFSNYLIKKLLVCISFCLCCELASAVNVKDFEAKGDGKADDTKAIIAAIRLVPMVWLSFLEAIIG